MTALVRAELLKVRTTRGVYAYLSVVIALAALGVAGTIGSAGQFERATLEWQLGLVDTAGVATLMALVFGIMIVTTEFRHGTITPTFLAMPLRGRVMAAKAAMSMLAGVAFVLLALMVMAAITVPWLRAIGVDLQLLGGAALERSARIALAAVLVGLLGVAIGAVLHTQVGALVGTLVWLLLGEPLIRALLGVFDLESIAACLPFRALDAVDGGGGEHLLGFWAGTAVVLGYVVGVGTLGIVRTRRCDIT